MGVSSCYTSATVSAVERNVTFIYYFFFEVSYDTPLAHYAEKVILGSLWRKSHLSQWGLSFL